VTSLSEPPPPAWHRHQAAGTQTLQGVDLVHGREASDALPAHRHDYLAAVGYVADIPTQMIMKVTHPDLMLELFLWRHRQDYTHHIRSLRRSRGAPNPSPSCGR